MRATVYSIARSDVKLGAELVGACRPQRIPGAIHRPVTIPIPNLHWAAVWEVLSADQQVASLVVKQ